jgi:hypothetical protein
MKPRHLWRGRQKAEDRRQKVDFRLSLLLFAFSLLPFLGLPKMTEDEAAKRL